MTADREDAAPPRRSRRRVALVVAVVAVATVTIPPAAILMTVGREALAARWALRGEGVGDCVAACDALGAVLASDRRADRVLDEVLAIVPAERVVTLEVMVNTGENAYDLLVDLERAYGYEDADETVFRWDEQTTVRRVRISPSMASWGGRDGETLLKMSARGITIDDVRRLAARRLDRVQAGPAEDRGAVHCVPLVPIDRTDARALLVKREDRVSGDVVEIVVLALEPEGEQ